MLREDASDSLIQTLPNPHADANQPGYVTHAVDNQYGVWYELRRKNAV